MDCHRDRHRCPGNQLWILFARGSRFDERLDDGRRPRLRPRIRSGADCLRHRRTGVGSTQRCFVGSQRDGIVALDRFADRFDQPHHRAVRRVHRFWSGLSLSQGGDPLQTAASRCGDGRRLCDVVSCNTPSSRHLRRGGHATPGDSRRRHLERAEHKQQGRRWPTTYGSTIKPGRPAASSSAFSSPDYCWAINRAISASSSLITSPERSMVTEWIVPVNLNGG